VEEGLERGTSPTWIKNTIVSLMQGGEARRAPPPGPVSLFRLIALSWVTLYIYSMLAESCMGREGKRRSQQQAELEINDICTRFIQYRLSAINSRTNKNQGTVVFGGTVIRDSICQIDSNSKLI